MMSFADRTQRNGFLLAVVHIVNRDWGELVRLYRKLGFIPEGTDLTPIETALEDALPDVLSADITELNFKNVVNKLGDIMYTCKCYSADSRNSSFNILLMIRTLSTVHTVRCAH
jgi:predicted unusual protein kinase regulating ubiquinone biosynthesis (AarF/ABC1/UbiB family)